MSNEVDGSHPSPRRNWYDAVPPWLVIVVFVCTGIGWLFVNWEKVEANAPRMWAAARGFWGVEPPPAASAPTPTPESLQKKAEPARSLLPCIDDASDIHVMVKALGGDKFERQFNKHFRGRETCFVLQLTGIGTMRLQFVTKTTSNWPPSFLVQPRLSSDLKRFRLGTRLRIAGELVRYVDLDAINQPDEIYVDRARVTEVSDADGSLATGSIRK